MYSALDDAALPAPGFPIRRSTGQRLFSTSPWLIAAVHVLLRLLVPRHPPCALIILTVSSSYARVAYEPASIPSRFPREGNAKNTPHAGECFGSSAVFKVHGGDRNGGLPPASLKTEQRKGRSRASSSSPVDVRENLPRKEVIQPQLPLRLPCYDFTPITGPTFDGSLP
jgi:hypothetical protein